MKAARLAAAAAGAAFAAAAAASLRVPAAIAWPRLSFPPDLLTIMTASAGEQADALAPAIAGAGVALVFSARSPRVIATALALANPLVLYALALGAGASLALAAAAILLGATIALARERSHGAAVGLGLAAAMAALISNSALALFPLALLLAPVLSPWGAAPRRLAGFATTVFAPYVMALLAILYLCWLIGPPAPIAVEAPAAAARDILLVLAGAGIAAIGANLRAPAIPIGLFAAGAAILAAGRPDLAAAAAAVLR